MLNFLYLFLHKLSIQSFYFFISLELFLVILNQFFVHFLLNYVMFEL